jgi:hypothetical protein
LVLGFMTRGNVRQGLAGLLQLSLHREIAKNVDRFSHLYLYIYISIFFCTFQFRNISSHLIGVDLSEAIMDEAEKLRPNLYDERVVGDVTEIIRAKKPVSLIVAADSFIYFGDLDPLFDSIQEGLDENNGYLAFTLENVSTEDEST